MVEVYAMSRDHKTTEPKQNSDGSQHYTRHSYENTSSKGVRESFDRNGTDKTNTHYTDQNTGETYYAQNTSDGKHKAGDVTDAKGNFIRNNNK
jgi:hypothetical protein